MARKAVPASLTRWGDFPDGKGSGAYGDGANGAEMADAAKGCWNDIEYSCSQILNECAAAGIPDIFSLQFMHEYTTFMSFDSMLQMMHTKEADINDVQDLVALDTPACDECVADYSEFASWRDLVVTACTYYLAHNLK